MSKIIFLGDSLTAPPQNPDEESWVKSLSKDIGLEYKNFAVLAGNNRTQVLLLQNYLLSDDYDKDDIFFWEITAINRKNTVVRSDTDIGNDWEKLKVSELLENKNNKSNYFYYVNLPNVFDSEKRLISLLCHIPTLSLERHTLDPYGLQCLEEVILQETVSHLVSLSRMGHKVITTIGWEKCVPSKYLKTFTELLSENNILYIKNDILGWCIQQGLSLADDMHPTQESTLTWAKTFLKPLLNETIEEDN